MEFKDMVSAFAPFGGIVGVVFLRVTCAPRGAFVVTFALAMLVAACIAVVVTYMQVPKP